VQGTISSQGAQGVQSLPGRTGTGQYTWVTTSNIAIDSFDGNRIRKIGGANAWNAIGGNNAYIAQAYSRGIYATCKTTLLASEIIFGLTSTPGVHSPTNQQPSPINPLPYSILLTNTNQVLVYEGTTLRYTFINPYTINSIFYILYDRKNIRFIITDSAIVGGFEQFALAVTLPDIPYYFDVYIRNTNQGINSVGFGPVGEGGVGSVIAVGEGFNSYVVGETLYLQLSGQDPTKSVFFGDGTTFLYQLTGANSSNTNNYRIDIDGVLQEPGEDYVFSSGNIIFTPTPPPSGSKIVVIQNNLRPLVGLSADVPKGGGNNKIFYENDIIVTNNYTITPGKNAMTAGPIIINTGITITVPNGSTWTVV
jgi:hypothetical protein